MSRGEATHLYFELKFDAWSSKHNGRVTQQPGCADLSQPLIYRSSMLSMAVCSSTSASSLQSVTGYCLAHQYMTSIHFCRERRDFAKKLASLMDLVVLHLLQYQQIATVTYVCSLSLSHCNPTPGVCSIRLINFNCTCCRLASSRFLSGLADDVHEDSL